jgi:predicted RNA-binding Zn ribbon-like protein
MLFIHDTAESLRMAADLVNTLPITAASDVDRLLTADDMEEFLAAHPYSGAIARDDRERAAVRGIRDRLHALWHSDRADAVPLVNAMLADGSALPRLVIHEPYDWHIHATDDDAPLAVRMMVESAMAFVDVIRQDAYDRVRVCSADDCQGVYVDFSRNGSKRYCDSGNCGNRMNVNAYRRRLAESD